MSPVEKNLNDAIGKVDLTQSSPSGERANYVSIAPFAGIAGSSEFPTYLSTRRLGGNGEYEWTTEGLLPPTAGGAVAHVSAFTEDLSDAVVSVGASQYLYNGSESLFAAFPAVETFSGASADDAHILFESEAALATGAEPGVPNLYEWESGRLLLVGVLSEGEGQTPAGGAVAGPGGKSSFRKFNYTQGTISEDGSRVFFTALGEGRIYMRETIAEKTIAVSPGAAEWRGSTPDGAYAFYTEGGGLYRFDANSQTSQLLTQSPAPEVQGTLGISSDGAYAYFVAKGELAGENTEGHRPAAGAENLYVWHEGASSAIAYIADLREGQDESDWYNFAAEGLAEAGSGEKSSRVTPSGTTVLFSSIEPLTGYDSNDQFELYIYDAAKAKLTCVSCNPRRQAATTGAYLAQSFSKGQNELYPVARTPFLTRNLSTDGERVFFQTEEGLVPSDSNGVSDVYEWENGQLYLISSGQSSAASYFSDASADGSNVFFFTRQSLVGEDRDNNEDLVDARVDGGIAAQNPVVTPPCIGEECHGTAASPPVFSVPSSAVFSSAGNLAPVRRPVAGRPRTRAQKLAEAQRACRKKTSRRRRAACRARARKRFGG